MICNLAECLTKKLIERSIQICYTLYSTTAMLQSSKIVLKQENKSDTSLMTKVPISLCTLSKPPQVMNHTHSHITSLDNINLLQEMLVHC